MSKQTIDDAVSALVGMGHKRNDAKRLVNSALVMGADENNAEAILRAVFARPQGTDPRNEQELLQVIRAAGEASTETIDKLRAEVGQLQERRGSMTAAAYQAALWSIPERYKTAPIHFTPQRDASGQPIDTPPPPIPEAEGLSGASQAASPITQEAIAGLIGDRTASAAPAASDTKQSITGMLNTPPAEATTGGKASALDQAQMAADAIGVIDQTGITDLANAGVSLTRALMEPGRAGEHLLNAGISAVSAIPIVGDAAKLLKYGRKGAGAAASAAGNGAKAAGALAGSNQAGGGVNAAAQAAMIAITGGGAGGGGGGGGNGTNPVSGGAGAQGGGSSGGGGSNQPAANNNSSNFGGAFQNFLNNTGAGLAVLGTVGMQAYEKGLKPLIGWFKQIDENSRNLLEHNRNLALYSGELGTAMQRLDTQRFMRDVAKAQDMSGSLSRLAGAQSRYEQTQQDLSTPYQKLAIDIQAGRTEIANYLLRLVDAVDLIGNAIDWFYGDQRLKSSLRNDAEKAEQRLDQHLTEKKLKDK